MDTQKLFLLIVFSLSVYLLVDAWQREKNPAPVDATQQTGKTQQAAPTPGEKLIEKSQVVAAPQGGSLQSGDKISVKTDYLLAEVDTLGGDLRRLELLKHRDTLDKSINFVLLQSVPEHVYVAQSGLIGPDLPNHKTRFSAENTIYELKPGADRVMVRLSAPEIAGIKVAKIYTFHKSSYVIDVAYEISNGGTQPIQPFSYFQFLRDDNSPAGETKLVPTYTGPAIYTEQEKFEKIEFSSIVKGKAKYPKNADNGWIAILQHYFLAAWLPKDKTPREFYMKKLDDKLYSVGVILPASNIEPGKTASISVPLYAGPQEQDALSKLAPGLGLTVDYGWLTVIALPLFWVLSWLHKWAQNWGVAIIMLTVIIKLLFYPLSATSYRSMAKMRMLAPKLQKIKEQYGDDRQRLHQAMMELYKSEKINPLGGCLPIVVQIPVFIALYWVLLASVELRHAPFALWIQDLSIPDPYFVLPIIMGITMVIQTYMSPTPPDPIQAKVMKIMPVAMSVFFFFFPAGLVLYWLVNNILSIAQQWQINRTIEQAQPAHGKR
ncbi:MAG TPA: membrane protein insertase YidC [Burkholderiales bacterium]|nr:membrane protein insertase YidC [Burkholderiales bacterium]